MNIKEQFRVAWPFAVVVIIFIVLIVLSLNKIYDVSDTLFGIAYLLLAASITYASIAAGKRFQDKGKYATCIRIIYGAGLLSGLWIYEAINYLF
ncbi:MAG TPA: hypothetical protein DDZ96_05410 [Porphyromonadaceae bacterium]|jgi:low temperature requirement protein LtrA|nr:hypothetical protein [Porphyromonadaceae bacterium]HBL33242.1 hypothetical protein [Porphyromonadaceae bacterium]HBX21516.1 hypothetical protein [Porphyromonadaceae bacterium]HCM19920.1 hypothetical protein [Porphyromonadaceae bacterium]